MNLILLKEKKLIFVNIFFSISKKKFFKALKNIKSFE
jgi:hypothetical protein